MRTTNQSDIQQQRRGAMVPLIAILLPIFIVMVAFAVDYGVISVGKQQLQNAADAGAMAALTAYQKNPKDGDQAALETINSHTLLGGQLQFDVHRSISYGHWHADSNEFIESPRVGGNANISSGGTIPSGADAVRVQLVRSAERGNAVRLFFAPIMGVERATIVAEAIAGGSAPCMGFIGIESATILNNATTDSYNSDDGAYHNPSNRNENGGICSEGDVYLASGADVFGNAHGRSVEIAPGSGATISGTIGGADTLDFDVKPTPSSNDNHLISAGPNPWDSTYMSPDDDLIVNYGELVLTSGTYHFRDMLLRGGSQLKINGDVEIFIDREMRFDNGTIANLGQVPKEFQLNVDQGPVNIQGGHKLHAVIYAPKADVKVENGSGFFGGIIGKTLTFAGGGGLHYDESLASDAEPTTPPGLVY